MKVIASSPKALISRTLDYDGASVKAEKKYLNFFSPPFFQKTAEKKYLNFFSPTFFRYRQKKMFHFQSSKKKRKKVMKKGHPSRRIEPVSSA